MPIPNPVAFTVFGIEVRWYGVLIALGMVLATLLTYKRAPRHGLEPDRVLDFILICIPVGIIGARLYYVVFNWSMYEGDFLKIINLRLGGLAIHGGLIFGIAAAVILCAVWKIRPLNVMDLAVPGVALAQAIGRWGNYFNSEAHGGPTDLPWAVTVNGQTYHPTFLYESIWCFLLFLFLIYMDNHRRFEDFPALWNPLFCRTLFCRSSAHGFSDDWALQTGTGAKPFGYHCLYNCLRDFI